jgi:Zn-dependent metalloprotease
MPVDHGLLPSILVILLLTNASVSECDRAKQQQALAALSLRAHIELDRNGIPSWIRGQVGPHSTEDPVQCAITTLESLQGAFCASNADGFAFTGRMEKEDELGQTHVRVKQTYRGIDVIGPELVVHMTRKEVIVINGWFLPAIDVPTEAVLSKQEASVIARSYVADMGGTDSAVQQVGMAVVFAGRDDRVHLAYPVETRYKMIEGNRYQVGWHSDEIFVDAIAGVVVGSHPILIRD